VQCQDSVLAVTCSCVVVVRLVGRLVVDAAEDAASRYGGVYRHDNARVVAGLALVQALVWPVAVEVPVVGRQRCGRVDRCRSGPGRCNPALRCPRTVRRTPRPHDAQRATPRSSPRQIARATPATQTPGPSSGTTSDHHDEIMAGINEHPRSGGQLGRHVDHGLAVGDQALGHVPADAVAALYRPPTVLEPLGCGEHLPVTIGVGSVASLMEHPLVLVHDLDGHRELVRGLPRSQHCPMCPPLLTADHVYGSARRATLP